MVTSSHELHNHARGCARKNQSDGNLSVILTEKIIQSSPLPAGGHAGGMLMPDRRDALCAASELILAIETAARSSGSIDTVATVGICDVFPGAINSVPSRVRISLDLRDRILSGATVSCTASKTQTQEISERRRVSIQIELLNADAPAESAPEIVDALSASCQKHKVKFMPIVSRAYHDSLFMARIIPVALLFIPCRHRYSYRPDEYAFHRRHRVRRLGASRNPCQVIVIKQ
jgi:ureidoglycolate amidohydrolase